MPNYNKVILIGNLTRDPELSFLQSKTAVCEFGLAVNRKWKSDAGEKEETCFVDCRIYGKSAETFKQYMAKGRAVLIEGRLQFDQWEGKDGSKRSKHRVIATNFQFLGDKGQAVRPRPPATEAEVPEPSGDDIPF